VIGQPVLAISALAASSLITGAGLAYVAAISFMAANFKRNKTAKLSPILNYYGRIAAYLSALAVLGGTIATFTPRVGIVAIVAFCNIGLAFFAIIASLFASRFFGRPATSEEERSDSSPIAVGDEEIRRDVSGAIENATKNKQEVQVEHQENGAVDVDVAQPLAKRGEGR
jgi:hypothetical protein